MSFDKSDTITYLEEACSRLDDIRGRLHDLSVSLQIGEAKRKRAELTLDRVVITGVSDITGCEAVAVEDLRDWLRTLINMIKQSTAEK